MNASNTESIYRVISPMFRGRRFQWFLERLAPGPADSILDVGGRPGTWTPHPPTGRRIDILNLPEEAECWDQQQFASHRVRKLVGDGCDLPAEDGQYDIVFSNSVIEHVGTWENQVRFAAEARRAGRKLWIQTPAREFFIEPHYLTPFIHWVPRKLRGRLLRHFTVWGWIVRPSPERAAASAEEIRLISYREFRRLFPDCQILVERFLGIFPKSYIAWRDDSASSSAR